MDSWFGKLREKLLIDDVTIKEDERDEERLRKEEQMRDTLRKMNTDQLLNDDEIMRISESSSRPVKEANIDKQNRSSEKTSSIAETADSGEVSQETSGKTEQVESSSERAKNINNYDPDEIYGSQFWD